MTNEQMRQGLEMVFVMVARYLPQQPWRSMAQLVGLTGIRCSTLAWQPFCL